MTNGGLPDRFEGTEPDPVDAGATLTIHFEDSGKPNTTVTVDVTNGTTTEHVEIDLDEHGKGTKEFEVPVSGWSIVRLEHESSEDHTVAVNPA